MIHEAYFWQLLQKITAASQTEASLLRKLGAPRKQIVGVIKCRRVVEFLITAEFHTLISLRQSASVAIHNCAMNAQFGVK